MLCLGKHLFFMLYVLSSANKQCQEHQSHALSSSTFLKPYIFKFSAFAFSCSTTLFSVLTRYDIFRSLLSRIELFKKQYNAIKITVSTFPVKKTDLVDLLHLSVCLQVLNVEAFPTIVDNLHCDRCPTFVNIQYRSFVTQLRIVNIAIGCQLRVSFPVFDSTVLFLDSLTF